jgi:hypothetical protein
MLARQLLPTIGLPENINVDLTLQLPGTRRRKTTRQCSEQPIGFRNQDLEADVPPPPLAASPECKNLIDELPCPLAGATNFGEVGYRLPTRADRGIGHFGIAEDLTRDPARARAR